MVLKVEIFTAEPPCPGCEKLLAMADELEATQEGKVEVIRHIGPCEEYKKYGLTVVPAVVIGGGTIKIMGVCPSKKTLLGALTELGV